MKHAHKLLADPGLNAVHSFYQEPNVTFPSNHQDSVARYSIVTTKSLMTNTPSEYLSSAELRDLTGSTRALSQKRWLDSMDVPNRLDGRRVIVSRIHVQAWLEGRLLKAGNGPNWSAMNQSGYAKN